MTREVERGRGDRDAASAPGPDATASGSALLARNEVRPVPPVSADPVHRRARPARSMHLVWACQPTERAERLGAARTRRPPRGSPPRGLGRPALWGAYGALQVLHNSAQQREQVGAGRDSLRIGPVSS